MSKKAFAERVNVTSMTILRYENGEQVPNDEMLSRFSDVLEFPVGFFLGNDIDHPRLDNASFRGLASKSARVMDAALASGTMAYLFDDWISSKFDRPKVDLPDLSGVDPAVAAKLMRQHWKLGDKPIENMVHLLEAKGIRVFSLAENTKEVDAFSVWRDDVPYIFLNRFKSAERSRFDAAHELAHLCMHKHGGAAVAELRNSPVEKEANAFAGAFLMPEADMRSIIKAKLYSVDDLVIYKRRWRVAAVALAYRALQVGLIPESRSNSFYVELSRRGWLKSEPQPIAREQSNIWQQVMDDLRQTGVTKGDISRYIYVPALELEALLFGLANMLSIEGTGEHRSTRRANLHVVK